MTQKLTVWYNTKCPVCNAGIDWQHSRLVRAARSGAIDFRDINLEPDALSGFGIGLAGSLMGVSGGSLSNIVLTLYGKPIHNAVATSAGLGVPITIVGTLGYILAGWHDRALLPPLSLGFVSLLGVVIMAPVATFTAPYGARLAHRLSRRTLEIAFSIFLLLISARFLISLF